MSKNEKPMLAALTTRASNRRTGFGKKILWLAYGLFVLVPAISVSGLMLVNWFKSATSSTMSSQNGGTIVGKRHASPNSGDASEKQGSHTLLMTEFGEFKSEQSLWAIRVSAEDKTLHISRQPGSSGLGISMSPGKWRAQAGWFAFIEDENHAWAYDGDQKLMLVEVTPEMSTVYETESIPRIVPESIMSRIARATRERIGIKAERNEGAKGIPTAQVTSRKNRQQFPVSPEMVIHASLESWCFIADVPESFDLTPENAWVDRLKEIPDVDIHADVSSNGMSGITLRKNEKGERPQHQFIQDFASIKFFSEFKDELVHFRGEIKEGNNQRLTEIEGSLAIDERMVIKLGPVPQKRLRYLVLWFFYATHHAKKSPEQMTKDREHALEWLSLLDRGDYPRAIASAILSPRFLGLNEVEWNEALIKIRKPRGAVISRVFKTAFEPGGIVGAQSGAYRLMQFETVFSDGAKTVESVTFFKDHDYSWKVVAYFIDAAPGAKNATTMPSGDPDVAVLAEQWLAKTDAGEYDASWKAAAVFFQKSITTEAWNEAMKKSREPLGEMKSRKFRHAQRADVLPGAPDGVYLVMRFDTSFSAKADAAETVTFMLEKDGTWRAAGYFIR